MDKIKVSILVPAYHVEAYLDECLQSLLSQTLKEVEIVVVDDASSDRTATIAEQYAASDSRIRVIRLPEHQGVSHARNACLAEAQGEYLSFVDSDDTISSTAMEELYHRAMSTDADIVFGSMLYCYPDGRQVRVGDKSPVFRTDNEILPGQECFIRMQQTGCYVPMVCSNLYRTAFIKAHPQLHFEGEFHEDEYFTPFALYEATRVTDFKKDFYLYRQRPESIMHSCKNIKQRAEALCFVSNALQSFIRDDQRNIDVLLRESLERYIIHLSKRSQELYEKQLLSSKRKCLLIFTEECNGASYGIGTYIKHLIQCFDLAEWDVNVVEIFKSNIDITFKLDKGVAYYGIPRMNNCQYFKTVFYYLASRLEEKVNIYCHFNFFGRDELATLFKKSFNAHIVFTLHYMNWRFKLNGDVERVKVILHTPTNIEEESIKANFEKERNFMLNCCDSIIAVSQHSYDTLHNLYKIPTSKLVLIPNAVPNSKYIDTPSACDLRQKYGFTETEKIILFVGRLEWDKGIFDLITAFKQVLSTIPEVRLIIAGNGNFNKSMEIIYPYNKFITFMGFITQEILQELYLIADVGVVPSYFEEFGYVAAEMMINQCPIIIRNTTGLKEITANGKYASDYFNDNKLKEKLVRYLTNSHTFIISKESKYRILENYSINLFRARTIYTYSYLETPNSSINNYNLIES